MLDRIFQGIQKKSDILDEISSMWQMTCNTSHHGKCTQPMCKAIYSLVGNIFDLSVKQRVKKIYVATASIPGTSMTPKIEGFLGFYISKCDLIIYIIFFLTIIVLQKKLLKLDINSS